MKIAEFPNVVCWDAASRAEVMNTMALDVRPEVFAATHYPSLIIDQKSQRRVDEDTYFKTFVSPAEPHILDVAVGDSGTGKSHFIRWLYNRVTSDRVIADNFCARLIPRSSANLADVVLELIREFHGDATEKLRRELESSQQRTTLAGAANRVLDEFAFVLDPENREGAEIKAPAGVDIELYVVLRRTLPAMLRDQAIRKWLTANPKGIVLTLAKHVSSRRGSRDELDGIAQRLTWRESDLEIDAAAVDRAGAEAREIASTLLTDDVARQLAANILNEVFADASTGLLGLKRGDLNRAILEIRRQLKAQGRELVLLIEDMSVAHGLDHDLLEALIVRTRDTGGEEACKLRAVVGVTNDDYSRMPDNIKGRIRHTLSFNVQFSAAAHGDDAEVGQAEIIDFASRYLNAARFGLPALERWAAKDSRSPLESFCVTSGCPNRDRCHRAFGAASERGLYPFTATTVVRLYRQRQSASHSGTRQIEAKAFNPRMMVADVLNHFLEEAERSVPPSHFPPRSLADTFDLHAAGAAVSDRLQQQFQSMPGAAERVLTAIELYAQRPGDGKLPPFVAEAFDLPLSVGVENRQRSDAGATPRAAEAKRTDQGETSPTTPRQPAVPSHDEFDRWVGGTGNNLATNYLNDWRGLVYEAVAGYIDWDLPGFAAIADYFQRQYINFEGQMPNRRAGGLVVLEIERSPQVALVLRGFKTRFKADDDATSQRMLELAGQYVRDWAASVTLQLRRIDGNVGDVDPRKIAMQYLALGAIIRAELPSNASDGDALVAAMNAWPDAEDAPRSTEWKNLRRTYRDYAEKARRFLADALTCSKNGRTGDFLDPTPVLDSLRRVRSSGIADDLPDNVDAWPSHFEPIRKLAEAVNRYLAEAIRRELQDSRAWLEAVTAMIGDEDFAETCKKIKKAAESAAAVDALGRDGAATLTSHCQRLTQRAGTFASCAEAIRKAIDSADRGIQLRAIAQLDRGFMDDALQVLRRGAEMLQAALRNLNGEASAANTIEGRQTAIAAQLKSLGDDLAELAKAGGGED